MKKKKTRTVGADSLAAKADLTRYDPLEIGEALTNDILKNVWECIDLHYNKINEPEFCVILIRANDPLIHGLKRHKFYAWPYLPKPRPEQVVFHYSKAHDSIVRLWSLPNAKIMAIISEMPTVAKQWEKTKFWCDTFFSGFMYDKESDSYINYNESRFYDSIRKSNNITLESESEFLNANRSELVKAGVNEVNSNITDPFDFSKISIEQVIDQNKPIPY